MKRDFFPANLILSKLNTTIWKVFFFSEDGEQRVELGELRSAPTPRHPDTERRG